MDKELLLVLKLSTELRSLRKELLNGFHTKFHNNVDPGTRGCRTCHDQPEDSKCVRYWTVEPSHHFEIHGKVITPYLANDPDRLPSIGKVSILILMAMSAFYSFICRAVHPTPTMFL